ncbi:uncharacterized protein LOC116433794 [Nomia melanderi]|uniref:uncharacterized protein LOC116433794 n=1 Tax=Nomia melanderi TaxID=2448451 RepID=UPI0013046928|nr:uncharacterized protein LOC116433794 [Nomia melanderi]XP_031848151.1 uncharacterized protein LOC116433794 [Nomia melanderi]XP_031848152.1 uncharacterized protein LOC116433794 [Nomia melanderi]
MYLNKVPQICFIYTFLIVHATSETFKILNPIRTNFSCLDKTAGFYADIDARCKIYHTCDEYGNKFTYRCPEETAFRQDALICDHAHLVDCQKTNSFHVENVKNKYNDSSCIRGSINNNNCEYFFQSSRGTQPRKTDSVVQHGFTLNLHRFLKNINEGNVSRDNTMKLFPSQTEKFQNQVGSRTNENFFIVSQPFNKNKINEKKESNQEDHFNKKTNITLHNFLKLPGQTLPKSIQDQQNNRNNNQIAKTSDVSDVLFDNNRNHPYIKTLNSIQKSTKVSSPGINTIVANTTEIPIYALTLSLKPLIPRELEYDPYYPKITSTESYYTPSHNNKKLPRVEASSQSTWSNTHIEFPSVLPDLRSLEDIVDRRKLLYIPRIQFN